MRLSPSFESTSSRFGLAIIVVVAAILLRMLLNAWLGTKLIYITFFPAVAAAAAFGGLWPGMFAMVISTVFSLVWLATREPAWTTIHDDLLGAMMFLFNGVIVVMVCDALQRSRRRANESDAHQRRAQAAFAQSEMRFRTLADAAPVLIWMSDATKAFIWFNKPWLDFVGRPMAKELDIGWTQGIHPDDLDRVLKTYGDSFDARQPFRSELRLRRHDGQFRWILGNGVPLIGLDGELIGYIGSSIDITDMKNAERALRENEERLRLGLSAGATGTWDWDIVTNRVTWSEQIYQFHGLTHDQFDGTIEGFSKLVHPDDSVLVNSAVMQAIEKGQGYQIEFRTIRPDESVRWLLTTGHVYLDEHRRPVRMLGATIDTTDRKRAEQERESLLASERSARSQAEHAGRMKDEFLATLSHELRTPLNAILGWSQVLQRSQNSKSDLDEGLAIIERNARVQTQLIEDLLDMSRIISGKIRLDVQRVELSTIIDAALESVQPSADAKEIRISKVIDPRAGPIKGDPARLQQIVWNLLSNAIKFTPRQGKIQITLERIDSHVEISVSDSGIGIDPSFLPYLFERFRQADSSTTRKHGGLGLGLAIVKQLAELHGGTIQARSAGDGQGATFRLALPLPAAQEIPADDGNGEHPTHETPLRQPIEAVRLDGVKVLVVDDELDARTLIKRVLEEAGASVTSVPSAGEGLEALRRDRFNLLLSDIGMPEMDGYSFVKQIRLFDPAAGGNIPAIALTAFARSEDRRRAMMAGFDMFVSKPIEPAELVAVILRMARRA